MEKLNYHFETNENGTVKCVWWQNPNGDGDIYYCTNKHGDGVFWVCSSRNERSQLVGTCDFSVYGLSVASARAKIRRWYNS